MEVVRKNQVAEMIRSLDLDTAAVAAAASAGMETSSPKLHDAIYRAINGYEVADSDDYVGNNEPEGLEWGKVRLVAEIRNDNAAIAAYQAPEGGIILSFQRIAKDGSRKETDLALTKSGKRMLLLVLLSEAMGEGA